MPSSPPSVGGRHRADTCRVTLQAVPNGKAAGRAAMRWRPEAALLVLAFAVMIVSFRTPGDIDESSNVERNSRAPRHA